jgi:primase-polymerase (primpol)-like protein
MESQRVHREFIPAELQSVAQWVCWRYVDRGQGKKPEKQPVNPRTLHRAGVHWSNTWTTFDEAYNTYLAYRTRWIQGIGFVLTEDDPYVAVDLDDCIKEELIEEYATDIIARLGSYTEVSPSGQGIRILVSCAEFRENVRRPQVELYSHTRYVTVTGL